MSISLNKAQQVILAHVKPLDVERVPLLDACGRVLAADLAAPWDVPLWNNSAMDGFAVRSEDCQGDTTLLVSDYLPAGSCADKIKVLPGHSVKIMTGAPVPIDCDAVVPFEETIEESGKVIIQDRVERGAHVRIKGEDLACNAKALSAGAMIGPPEMSLLASLGQVHVDVTRRPRVAILSTGDELVDVGSAVGPGQIINSNSYALAAAVREAGGVPVLLGIAKDEGDSLREAVAAGLDADALVTTAGVSMGDRDMVRAILSEYKVEELFWKIDIKPGRPTAFATAEGVPVFSLPGNPVSAMITFEFLVRPALLRMQGLQNVFKLPVKARLAQAVKKKVGRTFLMRVRLESDSEGLLARNPGDQNTGILTTLVNADGIAVLPAAQDSFQAGETVDVVMMGLVGKPS